MRKRSNADLAEDLARTSKERDVLQLALSDLVRKRIATTLRRTSPAVNDCGRRSRFQLQLSRLTSPHGGIAVLATHSGTDWNVSAHYLDDLREWRERLVRIGDEDSMALACLIDDAFVERSKALDAERSRVRPAEEGS